MKKILSISCMLLAFLSLNAQNVIPNAGFENWTDDKADNWTSSFSMNILGLTFNYTAGEQSTEAYSGNSAMLLQKKAMSVFGQEFSVPGICQLGSFNTDSITAMAMSMIGGGEYDIDPFRMVTGGAPFTEMPTKVKAWVKYTPDIEATDALQVYVLAGKHSANGDIVLATGTYNSMEALLEYTEIEVPLEVSIADETPDFINIIFSTSKSFNCGGSELLIDDITVESETGVYEINSLSYTLAPNPAHEMLTIDLHNNLDFSVEMYDLAGKKVLTENRCNGQTSLNVSNLNAGAYLLQVRQGNKISSQKVVIY